MNRRHLLGTLLALPLFAACSSGTKAFQNTDLTPAGVFPKLELTDGDGKVRQMNEFSGKVVIVFFGFTRSPDSSPSALRKYASLIRSLRSIDSKRVQLLFITLDPKRDAPQHADTFAQWFHPEFIGLGGSPAQINSLAEQFDVTFSKKNTSPTDYSIEYAADAYVIDPKGQLRLRAALSSPIEHITEDMLLLLDEK